MESLGIKAHQVGPDGRAEGPTPGLIRPRMRDVRSLRDLTARLAHLVMPDDVRAALMGRVSKYPEASLDYVWRNAQAFVAAATREVSKANRAANPVAPDLPAPVAEAVRPPVKAAPVLPELTRPPLPDEFEPL